MVDFVSDTTVVRLSLRLRTYVQTETATFARLHYRLDTGTVLSGRSYSDSTEVQKMRLIAVMISIVVLVFYSAGGNAQDENPNASKQMVIAVHQFILNDGTDEKEFEAFVLNEILPLYNALEGQTAYLMKGDRGLRTGMYSMVLVFPDVEARNRIYLPEGGYSEDFEKSFEGTDALFEKMDDFVVGNPWVNHTDYVNVVSR